MNTIPVRMGVDDEGLLVMFGSVWVAMTIGVVGCDEGIVVEAGMGENDDCINEQPERIVITTSTIIME